MSEPTEPETKEERYRRQTKEHFEVLGRFVQSFELMAHAARMGCIQLTSVGAKHQQLMNVAFSHQSMTAQPLFDLWRGIVAEIRGYDERSSSKPEADEDLSVMDKILSQMARQYSELVSIRNNLLHGTWMIGWSSPDQKEFSSLNLYKLKVTKGGARLAITPKDLSEMRVLIERIDSMTRMINRATGVALLRTQFKTNFVFDGKVWCSPDDHLAPKDETSPGTPPPAQPASPPRGTRPSSVPRRRKPKGQRQP